jgi:hypothetical protein
MGFAGVLIVKIVIASFIWSFCWAYRFGTKNVDVNPKTLGIVFLPWIMMFLYIMLFWWG